MIINIGGRGTGKTSRMLRDMIDQSIKDNKKAVLLVHNQDEVSRIHQILKTIEEIYPETKNQLVIVSYYEYLNTFKKTYARNFGEFNLYVDNLDYFASHTLGKDVYMTTMSSDQLNILKRNDEDDISN